MNPHHVLLVDVEPGWRDRLADQLRAGGDHPVVAPSGEAAAEAIASPGFDAVVVDLRAPDLDLTRLREALAPARPAEPDSLEQAERRHIALVLSHTGGNKRRAAQLLGISRSTLLHKVRKYRLDGR